MEGTIGEIRLFGGNFPPRNWSFCDGQLLAIPSNTALFSVLGTIYGGDGRTTFALPDLRSRVAIGAGRGPGLSNYRQGQQFGTESNTLDLSHLPAHTHAVSAKLKASNEPATTTDPTDAINAFEAGGFSYDSKDTNINVDMRADAVEVPGNQTGSTGGGSPLNNRQASMGLNFIICTSGNYPSRN